MNKLKRGIFQISDVSVGVTVAMVVLALLIIPLSYKFQSMFRMNNAASHAKLVSNAANKYILDNTAAITAATSPTAGYTLTVPMLISAKYLPTGFSASNSYSNTYRTLIYQPTANKLHVMTFLTGGTTFTMGDARTFASYIGASGGYIEGGIAKGTQGAWSESLASFGGYNPGDGHIVVSGFYKDSATANDYLYRHSVSGKPELNTMGTAINMASNNLNNVGTINATTGGISNNLSVGGDTGTGTLHVSSDSSVNGTAWANNTHTNNNTTTGSLNVAGDSSVNGTAYSSVTRTNGETYTGGWFRTTGDAGWYSEKWGGGLYMSDSTWIRAYGGKSIYTDGELKGGAVTSNGRVTAGEFLQVNGVAGAGNGCAPNGLIGRDYSGAILSCANGVWTASGKGKSGFYCRYTSFGAGRSSDYIGYTMPASLPGCRLIQPGDTQENCSCMKILLDY